MPVIGKSSGLGFLYLRVPEAREHYVIARHVDIGDRRVGCLIEDLQYSRSHDFSDFI